MGDSFLLYMQRLELIAFFTGYPFLYAFIIFITSSSPFKQSFKDRMTASLSTSYALIGTLYLGFLAKKLYHTHSPESIKLLSEQLYLPIWGILSVLFWVPSLSKKKQLCLFHSLVFIFLIVIDFINQLLGWNTNIDILKNDMRLYTVSLLLNITAFVVVFLISFLTTFKNKFANPYQ